MQHNMQIIGQQQSFEQSVIRRINKEIQQEHLNKDSRIILIPPTNENYHSLRAFYIIKEDHFVNNQQNNNPLQQQSVSLQNNQDDQFLQSLSKHEKFIYRDCVLEVNIIIPKTYPLSHPRFKFPQQPLHPSFKNETICCGISCYFKKNWEPTQTIFSGIETFCRSILSIPCLLKGEKKIDLTRDCNFEIINLINSNKQVYLDRCEKWAVSKGSLLSYAEDFDFCQYLVKNAGNPLVQEIQQRIQKIKDRRTAHQLRMLEKNAVYFQSLSISMVQQILNLTQKPDLLPPPIPQIQQDKQLQENQLNLENR